MNRGVEGAMPGFLVTERCLDCDTCRALAPWHFRRWPDGERGPTRVELGPRTAAQAALCRMCAEVCPHDAIEEVGRDVAEAEGGTWMAAPTAAAGRMEGVRGFRWVGPWATAGQPTEEELGWVRAAGGEAVINLALPTSERALADERAVVTGLGMDYEAVPVEFEAPTAQDFESFAAALERHECRRVLIHCARNWRVSAFVYLYRVLRNGEARSEAREDLRAVWEPDAVWSRFLGAMESVDGTRPAVGPGRGGR